MPTAHHIPLLARGEDQGEAADTGRGGIFSAEVNCGKGDSWESQYQTY